MPQPVTKPETAPGALRLRAVRASFFRPLICVNQCSYGFLRRGSQRLFETFLSVPGTRPAMFVSSRTGMVPGIGFMAETDPSIPINRIGDQVTSLRRPREGCSQYLVAVQQDL